MANKTKAELLEEAKEFGLDVTQDNTNAEIQEAIDQAKEREEEVSSDQEKAAEPAPETEQPEQENQDDQGEEDTPDDEEEAVEGEVLEEDDRSTDPESVKFHLEHGTPPMIISAITGRTEKQIADEAKFLGYQLDDRRQGRKEAPSSTGVGVQD